MLTEVEEETLTWRRAFLSAHDFPADEFSDSDVLLSPAWIRKGDRTHAFPGWRLTAFHEESNDPDTGPRFLPRSRSFVLDMVWESNGGRHSPGESWDALVEGDVVEAVAFEDRSDSDFPTVYLPAAIVSQTSWLSRNGIGASLSLRSSGRFTLAIF